MCPAGTLATLKFFKYSRSSNVCPSQRYHAIYTYEYEYEYEYVCLVDFSSFSLHAPSSLNYFY